MIAETIIRTEHQEQGRLFKWAKDHEHEWGGALKTMFAIPNGGLRVGLGGINLKREGVRSGVPDIFVACPRGGYAGLFLELKRAKGGNVSTRQSEWHKWLTDEGYKVLVCHGADAAIVAIGEYLGGVAPVATSKKSLSREP